MKQFPKCAYGLDNSLLGTLEMNARGIWLTHTLPTSSLKSPSTPLGSLLIPCTHLTDISVASEEQHQIPEMWSPDQGPAVPGTVVHNGKKKNKTAPVLFSLIGSLCWGRGKICKGFGGPTCPLSSWRETAACPRCMPSPVQVLKDLPAVPGALSQSCLEKPHRRPDHKWDIHSGRQLFLRNPSGTRMNHAKLLNPTNLNLKQNLIG